MNSTIKAAERATDLLSAIDAAQNLITKDCPNNGATFDNLRRICKDVIVSLQTQLEDDTLATVDWLLQTVWDKAVLNGYYCCRSNPSLVVRDAEDGSLVLYSAGEKIATTPTRRHVRQLTD